MVERTKHLKESYERVRSLTTELALTEQRGRRQLALELHDYLAQLLVVTQDEIVENEPLRARPARKGGSQRH